MPDAAAKRLSGPIVIKAIDSIAKLENWQGSSEEPDAVVFHLNLLGTPNAQ